jgi:hemerythrin-like domain-containing protein
MNTTITKPTDVLRSEHEVILDVLCALESISREAARGGALDLTSAREALEFLRNFADRCHHGKEEQHFFPALTARGMPADVGPLAVMTSDHDEGRALIQRMVDALSVADRAGSGGSARFAAAADAYVGLMRDHIAKENGVLFPMGDGMLSSAQQAAVLRGFETFEHADMAAGDHQRFLALAAKLCERWNVRRAPTDAETGHVCCGHGRRGA